MSNKAYYQRNREMIWNNAKDNHKNNKEKLREQIRNKYRNLPEEEKNKKREYEKKQISQDAWRKKKQY